MAGATTGEKDTIYIKFLDKGMMTIPKKIRDRFVIGKGVLGKVEETEDGFRVRVEKKTPLERLGNKKLDWQDYVLPPRVTDPDEINRLFDAAKGMWADREDMKDSVAYVNNLRKGRYDGKIFD